MKIYKTIFRLDFPLAYKILDKFGEYLELIKTNTDKESFSEGQGNINLVDHSLSYSAKEGQNLFNLNLNLKTFNSVIEFNGGIKIGNLYSNSLFSLADEIIEKLEEDHGSKYNRIGVRNFILLEKAEFEFDKIKEYIWNNNDTLANGISDHFDNKLDIGVVFESKSEDDKNIRLSVGPYQKSEFSKYFMTKNEVVEGIIFDIDIWQPNLKIPKLKIVEIIKEYLNISGDLVKKIESKILEDLK